MNATMMAHADLARFPELYFRALSTKDLASVPWADDVVFQGSVHSEPLHGRPAVEAFLNPLLPALDNVRLMACYSDADTGTVVGEAQVGPLYVMDRFVIRDGRIVNQRNVYDPRPLLGPSKHAMSVSDRRLLVELLTGSRQIVLDGISGIPPERWLVQPSSGSWSPAECAEHLILSEEALLQMVQHQILKSPPDPEAAAPAKGKEETVIAAMRDRSVKAQTFDFLQPRSGGLTQKEAITEFDRRRTSTLDYAWTSQDPVHAHVAPLPGLGQLDAFHWLVLLAAHTERHVAQMKEAAAANG
jgi:hypothetical protein